MLTAVAKLESNIRDVNRFYRQNVQKLNIVPPPPRKRVTFVYRRRLRTPVDLNERGGCKYVNRTRVDLTISESRFIGTRKRCVYIVGISTFRCVELFLRSCFVDRNAPGLRRYYNQRKTVLRSPCGLTRKRYWPHGDEWMTTINSGGDDWQRTTDEDINRKNRERRMKMNISYYYENNSQRHSKKANRSTKLIKHQRHLNI